MQRINKIFIILFVCLTIFINLVSAVTDSNQNNNGIVLQINVSDTREILINFIPIDYFSTNIRNFTESINNNSEFINFTYPISGNKISFHPASSDIFYSEVNILTKSNQEELIKDLYVLGRISGKDYDRVVGLG